MGDLAYARRVLEQLGTPRIALRGSSVSVLDSPAAFYERLVERTRGARKRIRMASLYVGTGAQEAHLVRELTETAHGIGGCTPPCVSVLLDRMRATRPGADGRCSLDVLLPLIRAGARPARSETAAAEVQLFHPPALTRALLQLPSRLIEAVAVQHVKAYVFDDSTILTGANLSADYFTSRHDRYVEIHNEPGVAALFDALLRAIGDCSFTVAMAPAPLDAAPARTRDPLARLRLRLAAPTALGPAPACAGPTPPAPHPRLARVLVTRLEAALTLASRDALPGGGAREPGGAPADTWLVPTVQLGSAGLRRDQAATGALIRQWHGAAASDGGGGLLSISSPYLNLPDETLDALSARSPSAAGSRARAELLTGSVEANGFYGASGLARHIPYAYAHLELRALRRLARARAGAGGAGGGSSDKVELRHWLRPGCTFHAKGLWYTPPPPRDSSDGAGVAPVPPATPLLTVIGSSNYGARSAERDLELQAVLVTTDPALRTRLGAELHALRRDSRACGIDELETRVAARCSRALRWLTDLVLARFL